MIWIIGGTINATEISNTLVSRGWPVLVSVTTAYGGQLSASAGAEVLQGMLQREDMADLITSKGIKLVVDASHPFATEVSSNAMQAAKQAAIPYLRFERQNPKFDAAIYANDYAEAVEYLNPTTGNILLTTGSKNIRQYLPLGLDRLYARVLSSSDSIAVCENAGMKPSHIIGISGVCSVALNVALLQEFGIKYMVTKESGTEGGFPQKMEAAIRTGTKVIILRRPAIAYPETFSEYELLWSRIKGIYESTPHH
jgi:precorrin-6A/cobalt-precorrin-6A reductase